MAVVVVVVLLAAKTTTSPQIKEHNRKVSGKVEAEIKAASQPTFIFLSSHHHHSPFENKMQITCDTRLETIPGYSEEELR